MSTSSFAAAVNSLSLALLADTRKMTAQATFAGSPLCLGLALLPVTHSALGSHTCGGSASTTYLKCLFLAQNYLERCLVGCL